MQGVYEERSGAGDISVNAIIPADLVDDGNTTIDFDEYTNSDGIIHSYEDVYMWDYYVDDRTITDDPIVQIIPKDLFFMLGTHIHVGKEYGFFVRVTTDPISTTGYAADVMVFDITHFEPAFATDSPGGARVAPLFQYRYRVTDEPGQEMAVGLSQVVIPHLHYDAAEYFLKGVTFKFTLENPTALNPGDNGYNPYEDDGAFIIQTRANMSGVKQKSKGASFVLDTVEYALGFSRFAGPILSTYAYVNGLYKGFAEGEYFYHCDPVEANHESLISTDYTNSTDQIWNYGNLIKSATVTFKSEPESKYLVNVGGGYAEGLYVIARKSGSQYDLRRIVTSVAVRIVEDNTYAVSNYEFGEIIEHGCATGTYEVGRYKRLSDVTSYEDRFVIIPKGLEEYIMKITVPISGNYRIRTVSLTNNNGDPNFYMINATQGVAVGTVIDDIDYPYNNNATLTTSLTAGDVYYLVAYRYGLSDEYALQIELIS